MYVYWRVPDVLGGSLLVCGPHRHGCRDLLGHLLVQGSAGLLGQLGTEHAHTHVSMNASTRMGRSHVFVFCLFLFYFNAITQFQISQHQTPKIQLAGIFIKPGPSQRPEALYRQTAPELTSFTASSSGLWSSGASSFSTSLGSRSVYLLKITCTGRRRRMRSMLHTAPTQRQN